MQYLPSLRRFLYPALVSLALVIFYKTTRIPSSMRSLMLYPPPPVTPPGPGLSFDDFKHYLVLPPNESYNYISPDQKYYHSFSNKVPIRQGTTEPILSPLFRCFHQPNIHTKHLRIPFIVQTISQVPPKASSTGERPTFNPTIISLPYWSKNQYLLVSRVVTEGLHTENLMCEANTCYAGSVDRRRPGEVACTDDDLSILGPAGGLRCAHEPILVNAPPTPSEQCEREWESFADLPGFHDPRIFWSGKGEPLIIVNTHSRYTCFGLWIMDLRSLYPPLITLLSSSPDDPSSLGPLTSYPTITELTRNPPSTRSQIEKNWFLFFPSTSSAYLHYELSSTQRSFAKLIGNGYTTPNLTDPFQLPCLNAGLDPLGQKGTWHQATNSLRLILCHRRSKDNKCHESAQNTVFFAVVHRKFSNILDLPLRYERFFVVWSASPPFHMLAVSKHPILMYNETAAGWSGTENWADEHLHRRYETSNTTWSNQTAEVMEEKENWAYFTYTPSIAWAWGRTRKGRPVNDKLREKNTGYLDDEVILGIGIDDNAQAFARAPAEMLLQCMKSCPGRNVDQT